MVEVNLSQKCTLGVGGVAKAVIAKTTSDLEKAYGSVIIGGGSNLLISGKNLPPITINKVTGIFRCGRLIYARSGERTSKLVSESARYGLSGLEWAYGLPGTVGGAVVCNAGANGVSVSDALLFVDVVERGVRRRLSVSECGFAYRASRLDSCVVLGACFALNEAEKRDILQRLDEAKSVRARQPKGRSAGCCFKNPHNESAGKLIDECGLKGLRVGGAVVSDQHANFIINDANATPNDIYELILTIEKAVYERFNIRLEREIRIIGEF